jgi:hypothetical protein
MKIKGKILDHRDHREEQELGSAFSVQAVRPVVKALFVVKGFYA